MAKLAPLFNGQTVTDEGVPASGWKINTYVAGSSTPQATYTAEDGLTAQANPIVLDADGFPPNPIWLTSGEEYKFILTDENDVVQRTFDNVSGVNDTTTSVSQWQASGLTPTYIDASSFSLVGDQTTEFHVGRRLQFTVTAGTVYGTISASAYTSLTTLTVAMDSGESLDSGLSAVNLSLIRADKSALPRRDYEIDSLLVAAGESIVFEGTTNDAYELSLSGGDPTADRAIALPDKSGTLATDDAASTSAKGLVELADATEARALSDALKAITPSTLKDAFTGTNQSIATPGYQKLPGGLIVQWLTGTTSGTAGNGVNHNFPIAFPTACLGVLISPFNQTVGSGSPYTVAVATSATTQFASQASASSIGFFAVAIGY